MLPYRRMSFILSIVNFMLLLVAQSSSGWATYLENPLQPVYTGLWTFCTDEGCSYMRIRETNLDVVRSFMLVALFSCFIAILCSSEWDYLENCTEDFFLEGPIASICSFISGTCVLIAVVVFDISVRELTDPNVEKLSNKWAFFLSCIASVLCYTTGIFSLSLYKLSLWKTTTYHTQVGPED